MLKWHIDIRVEESHPSFIGNIVVATDWVAITSEDLELTDSDRASLREIHRQAQTQVQHMIERIKLKQHHDITVQGVDK